MPDSTVALLPLRLTCRQPRAGIPVRPPCRANQAAAAAGVGSPPRSDTSDSANPDRFGQDEAAAWTSGAGAAGAACDPHAVVASRPANRQLPARFLPPRIFL